MVFMHVSSHVHYETRNWSSVSTVQTNPGSTRVKTNPG